MVFSICTLNGQVTNKNSIQNNIQKDSVFKGNKSSDQPKTKEVKASIEQYLIISSRRDTTFLDTTLSIKKEYKFNYLRKDNFKLMPFSNIGQTYNSLSLDFNTSSLLPQFGARARHFNYFEVDDINYYNVPTPLTELFFKTAFEQGQLLDAFFTVNTSPRFNFSIAYKGLRSLGNYQHILTSTGNLRMTANYKTKNGRYYARTHIVTQDLFNEENGGLKDEDLINFENGIEDFLDRGVFDPQFENAENILRGKRFYLDHEYALTKANDSISNQMTLGQMIYFEDKYYQFDQTSQSEMFGETFVSPIRDRTTLENFYNRFYFAYRNQSLGQIQLGIDYNDFNYGYDSNVLLNDQRIPNRIKDNVFALYGSYDNFFGKLDFSTQIKLNISGLFSANSFKFNVNYAFNEDSSLHGSLNLNSRAADYNFLLNQSGYVNYNWNNLDSYDNINTQQLVLSVLSSKLANINFDYTIIDNHTYFGYDDTLSNVKPFQYLGRINYLRAKVNKELNYGKFSLDNTVMYQNVQNSDGIINVPELISRNTLYYSNHFFKKALFLQTGVTLNYFSKYNMDAYDPLLAEFYVQNKIQLGGFPRFDFFINAKVRQTRIFLKAEHFNSAWTGYNYFSAPNYPYRDFKIRFGLVWDFFL